MPEEIRRVIGSVLSELGLVEKADKPTRPMKVQSLIFSKEKFKSAADARKWASEHSFKATATDETGSSFRIRQEPPGKFKKMRTITLTDGVKAVVGKHMVRKTMPTSSDVHVPTAGTEETPHNHKQQVFLRKDRKGRILPNKTAGQLHRHITGEHGNIGGTIRTGSRPGSQIDPRDGESNHGTTERFVFGPMVFDIDKAREMDGQTPNAAVAVTPDWSHMINVDEKAALKSTSENPVMIAQIPTTNGLEQLLIDGHHRMHKAMHEGKEEIPAHVFSPEETLQLMDTTPDLMDKMVNHLERTKPTVSTEDPGDGPVGKDLPPDKMTQARNDVGLKSDPAIELDTAKTWAARAIAAFEQGDMVRAEDYGHEALEHAALVKDGGASVGQIEQELRKAGLYSKIEKAYSGDEGERALAGGLITLPKNTKVDNCTNCSFIEKNYCNHPKMRMVLKSGAAQMCCDHWYAPGVQYEGEVQKTQSFAGAHSADVKKDDTEADLQLAEAVENLVMEHFIRHLPEEMQEEAHKSTLKDTEEGLQGDMRVNPFSNSGARSSGGMGDNVLAGMYDMQQIVDGMDWELAHETADPELAKEMAVSNLQDDPLHYRKLRFYESGPDYSSGWGIENAGKALRGLKLDLGSGTNRESGHIGFDLQKHDHGTFIHDLHMGIPVPDQSAVNVLLRNSLEYMDELSNDPKPLLSEIERVLMPGGQFVYEGPNQIHNYPKWLKQTWREKFRQQQDREERDAGITQKIEGKPMWRQEFARIANPDAATSQDSEPRIGVAQYDMLPADALLAMDALGYYWSDATSSGRGNRIHGYPSQGSLVKSLTDAALTATQEAEPPQPHSVTESGPGRLALMKGREVKIHKADPHKQVVYGVVLAPDEIDLQEDWMTPEEIEKTAHFFMMNGRTIGKAHESVAKAVPVESYIAPMDMQYTGQYGDQTVKKGSWVLGVKVLDPEEWKKVVSGEYTGFSVGGWGQRTDSEGPGEKQW
jgi:SAM-dependent methyltransferase